MFGDHIYIDYFKGSVSLEIHKDSNQTILVYCKNRVFND